MSEHSFTPVLDAAHVRQLSPLTLAFVGDAAYELALRTMIVQDAERTPKDLQQATSHFAKAVTQAKMVEGLQASLTAEETDVFIRGRNSHSHTMAKHATAAEYRAATGLEAVFGYLYLSGQNDRMLALIEEGVNNIEGR